MYSSHEAHVEIRKMLPIIEKLNKKALEIFCNSKGLAGPQALTGPESDISYVFQYLHGTLNYIKAIAEHYDFPLPNRGI